MLPPKWFIRTFWAVHRAVVRWTGGRVGLWKATPAKWGTMRLRTIGRTSGKERIAILGYHEDGRNLVTTAMNGGMEGHPAWWLNLQAHPDATIELPGETRHVRARTATGPELDRLWALFPGEQQALAHRETEPVIVVLEPRTEGARG
jgi:deazaflavin-dependent oxidoreductase (nitroreductase family)